MSDFRYRADIDGLRSIAVLPVVAFHLNLSFVPGGFAGVDVFFVISGFLITRIIADELADGTFSLANFYRRRVLRLFPALLLMMLATLAAAYIWFVPADLANAGQSAIAAVLFASNILFFLEAGYFDASAYTKPLLHTWSLAIEEQFYVIMPLLLMLLWRWSYVFWPVVMAITLVSFGVSALSTTTYPTAAYYLLPWRAWELGIGALLALGVVPAFTNRLTREIATVLGLALILVAILMIDRTTPFPGTAALLPTLGAALILHAGQSGESLVSRGLSHAVPVFVGKLSYSLYLSHWPVIVFFTYQTLDLPDATEAAVLFVFCMLLAWLSFRFVERPFRRPSRAAPNWTVFVSAALAASVVMAVAGLQYVTKGFPNRLPAEAARIATFNGDFHPDRFRCWEKKSKNAAWGDPCIYGSDAAPVPTIALIGDSHASAFVPALEAATKADATSFALLGNDGCPGFRDLEVFWIGEEHSCSAAMDAAHQWLDDNPQVSTVVLMIRPAIYVYGWLPYGMREYGRGPLLIGSSDGPLSQDANRLTFFAKHLRSTIRIWRDQGRDVVLVYPLPEAANHVPRSIVRQMLRNQSPDSFSMARSDYDDRNKSIIALYDDLTEELSLSAVRTDEIFCGADICPLVVDGTPIYYDSNHLTATHAQRIAPTVADAIKKAAE